jgi:peptidoglycan/xylan/chitin deacetylase (PgdA/CDA1 family)
MSGTVVLMYHVIDAPRSAQESRYCCRPAQFDLQMRHLRRSAYTVIGLSSLVESLQNREPPPDRAVVVTVDDGFKCAYQNALPVLAKYEIPAVFFAVTDRLGGTNDWMTARGSPSRDLLTPTELRALADAGMSVGSHTRTHPRLTEISPAAVMEEVRGSKKRLEDILSRPVTYLAYPFGAYDQAVRDSVESAGYEAACSVRDGFNRLDTDLFGLRRIEVFGRDSLRRFVKKVRFGANNVSLISRGRRLAGRLARRLAE